MKFLCDRCKTRYSIGDERVRGKILKIRCKNCANVITVREGMSDVDPGDPQGAQRRGTTQAVPVIAGTPAAGMAPSTGAASSPAAGTRPPPALEEEWYVSIDGEQQGPFALPDAQRWVAGKPHDADLHCWSEGFDDWLPVDKVSHFRGSRAKAPPRAATAVPPPMPRAATAAGVAPRAATAAPAIPRAATAAVAPRVPTPVAMPRTVTPAPRAAPRPAAAEIEDEPRPLFAATMAALEKPTATTGGPGGTAAVVAPRPAPQVTPARPAATNGTNGSHARAAVAPAPAPTPSPTGSGAFAARFDIDDTGAPESATQIDAPVFPERPATVDIFANAANAPITSKTDSDDDDGLSIGEVSRVVKLADLQRPKPRAQTQSMDPARRTGAVASLGRTGMVPRLATVQVPRLDDAEALAAIGGGEAPAAPTAAHHVHRRGMIILISVAAVLLAAGALAVVMFVGGDDGTSSYLGRGETIDTTRPDDPTRAPGMPPGPGSAVLDVNPFTPKPTRPRNPGSGTTTPQPPLIPTETPGAGRSLASDEIEAMAAKYSSSTQRCYMRSQKGADAILIGDVKKIAVTLTVGADGAVSDVQLSDNHATNNLGKCLITSIRSWKFRASPGGTFRISLQFVSG